MELSRLALALVVSLRAVLVYGEAAGATAELTWADLLPARLRVARPSVAAPQSVRALSGRSA